GALNFAWDVAVQPGTDSVFVANRESHQVRVFDGDTAMSEIAHWGKQGTATGPSIAAQFKFPQGVAFAPDGTHLFVVDSGNNRVVEMTHGGAQMIQFKGTDVGAGAFDHVFDAEVSNGYLYVSDVWNNRIAAFAL